MQLFTPYNGTGGYVERPASMERAVREAEDGTLSARQQAVLDALWDAGLTGATWRTLGQLLNLHHGQVSGVLSILHKEGMVFMLRKQQDRCHPYVSYRYRFAYNDEDVYDKPVETRAGQRKALLDDLYATCAKAVDDGWSWVLQEAINSCVDRLREHDRAD
jgi:hypothetical protein